MTARPNSKMLTKKGKINIKINKSCVKEQQQPTQCYSLTSNECCHFLSKNMHLPDKFTIIKKSQFTKIQTHIQGLFHTEVTKWNNC